MVEPEKDDNFLWMTWSGAVAVCGTKFPVQMLTTLPLFQKDAKNDGFPWTPWSGAAAAVGGTEFPLQVLIMSLLLQGSWE